MEEKKSLSQMAKEIRDARRESESQAADKLRVEREEKCKFLIARFKESFKDLLYLFDQEDISYTAHYKTAYAHQGAYISFKKTIKPENITVEVKMDFSETGFYRLEYTKLEQTGRMVFGHWSMDDFIIWFDEEIQKQYRFHVDPMKYTE